MTSRSIWNERPRGERQHRADAVRRVCHDQDPLQASERTALHEWNPRPAPDRSRTELTESTGHKAPLQRVAVGKAPHPRKAGFCFPRWKVRHDKRRRHGRASSYLGQDVKARRAQHHTIPSSHRRPRDRIREPPRKTSVSTETSETGTGPKKSTAIRAMREPAGALCSSNERPRRAIGGPPCQPGVRRSSCRSGGLKDARSLGDVERSPEWSLVQRRIAGLWRSTSQARAPVLAWQARDLGPDLLRCFSAVM